MPRFLLTTIVITLLVAIVPLIVFMQRGGYVDMDKYRELVNRKEGLEADLARLSEEASKQRSTIEAMQGQAKNLEAVIRVAPEEAADLQQETDNKQAEIDDIEQRMEDLKLEIKDTEEKIDACRQRMPCFACDTLVLMADNSLKHISDMQVGEMVQAYDVETEQTVTADVMATNNGEADYYYLINGNLRVVPPHPFFTAEDKWVKIADLKVGDKVRSLQGLVEITSIERVNSGQRICNIGVRDFHNFFVSANGRDFYLVQE